MTTQENQEVQEIQEVKTPETPESQEKDYINLYENMQKALKAERVKHKETEPLLQELEDLRTFKTKLEEKEAKKRGDYEKLLEEKDNELLSLREKAKLFDALEESKKAQIASELEELETKLPEEVKKEYSDILDGLE